MIWVSVGIAGRMDAMGALATDEAPTQVIARDTAYLITRMMRDVVTNGIGRRAQRIAQRDAGDDAEQSLLRGDNVALDADGAINITRERRQPFAPAPSTPAGLGFAEGDDVAAAAGVIRQRVGIGRTGLLAVVPVEAEGLDPTPDPGGIDRRGLVHTPSQPVLARSASATAST